MSFGGRSTADIAHFLQGINFPCSKDDIINFAKSKNAPDNVIDTLNRIPDTVYNSMADVFSGVGEVS